MRRCVRSYVGIPARATGSICAEGRRKRASRPGTKQAVDLDTGAIVAITTHGGATGDTASLEQTLPAAGLAVAEQIDAPTAQGPYQVHAEGPREVVTDKGYPSGPSLVTMREVGVRSYVSVPKQPRRKWNHKAAEQAAVYANQRRTVGERGQQLLRRRGEFLERPFAHSYETGGLRRMHVRGRSNVAKRVLLQAAAFNLALILRSLLKAGSPRSLTDLKIAFFCALWGLVAVFLPFSALHCRSTLADFHHDNITVSPFFISRFRSARCHKRVLTRAARVEFRLPGAWRPNFQGS